MEPTYPAAPTRWHRLRPRLLGVALAALLLALAGVVPALWIHKLIIACYP